MKKTKAQRDAAIWRCFNRLVRPLGVMILPSGEIDAMEAEGYRAASHRKHRKLCRQEDGYFNGIADAYTRKARTLRARYLPNVEVSHGDSRCDH